MKLQLGTQGLLGRLFAALFAGHTRRGAAGHRIQSTGITLGARARVRRGTVLDTRGGSITIGDDAWIGPDVTILTGDPDLRENASLARMAPVTIGAGASIGARATILPGVRIGAGALVGVGAVVTGDVAPGTILAGAPARPVGWRRDDGSLQFAGDTAPAANEAAGDPSRLRSP